MNRIIFFTILFFSLGYPVLAQNEFPSVFNANRNNNVQWLVYQNNNKALYQIIYNEAESLIEKRQFKVSALKTREHWQSYQKELRKKVFSSLSGFSKTPLNAQVTGTLKRESFSVEKIVFESHPGFYVTGCLFLPYKRQNPAPAIIYCSGHTELSFRNPEYQKEILNLVQKGFIVYGFDPIGQGERLQYLNSETGKSNVGGPTSEHSYAGVQTLLTGTSLSDYFIWDGVRVIDYLETRKEIDSKRIGITGRSGGGTQSAMIAAFDLRIAAAAPECYLTSFKRLLQSIGPQDAEQNPFNALKNGFDHADFLHLRAPWPTLMVTTTHDFFSIQGARETFNEGKCSFNAFGKPENLQMTEDFGKHESTKKNRESIYSFFQKHLLIQGDSTDNNIIPFKPEELQVTKTGQVRSSLKSENVFSLNKKYFSPDHIKGNALKTKIMELSGIDFNYQMKSAVFTGKLVKKDFTVEKYFIENNLKDYVLPVYKIIGNKAPNGKIMVWLKTEGKEKLLSDSLLIPYINSGFTIYSADLPGNGELKDENFKGDGFVKSVPFNYTFGANLTGQSICGIQTEALDLLMQFIERDSEMTEVFAIADEGSSDVLLHYAVLKNPFRKIVLFKKSEAYLDLITTEYYDPKLAFSVPPGSLKYCDVRDLMELLPKDQVVLIKSDLDIKK